MQVYEEGSDIYGLAGVTHASKLTATLNQPALYCERIRWQTEMQETGSDASTADTTPYLSEDVFFADMRSAEVMDMAWRGCYPHMTADNMPFPTFSIPSQNELQQPWQQTGWGDLQEVSNITLPDFPTVGSAKHGDGKCKPCAFYWKPEGCESGAECQFCHFCPPGEKQRRKRVLRQLTRSLQR